MSSISFIIRQFHCIAMKRYLLSIILISTLLISVSAEDQCISIIYFDISIDSDKITVFNPDDGSPIEYNIVVIVNVTHLDNVKLKLDHFHADMGFEIEEIETVGLYSYNIISYHIDLRFEDISDETGNTTLVAEGIIELTECETVASTQLISFPIPGLMALIGCLVIYNKFYKSCR